MDNLIETMIDRLDEEYEKQQISLYGESSTTMTQATFSQSGTRIYRPDEIVEMLSGYMNEPP